MAGIAAAGLLAGGAQPARAGEADARQAYFGAGDARQLAPSFRELAYRGVVRATVGEADGVEAVRVDYNPAEITFADLLRVYFRLVDANDGGGQFNERGPRFAPTIWCGGYTPDDPKEAARALNLLAESMVFGNRAGEALAVRVFEGRPASFEVDDAANAAPLVGKALVQARKKSGRFRKLDDGLWGFVEYCEKRVCGYYENAPRCQGTCRVYYPDGKLGLSR